MSGVIYVESAFPPIMWIPIVSNERKKKAEIGVPTEVERKKKAEIGEQIKALRINVLGKQIREKDEARSLLVTVHKNQDKRYRKRIDALERTLAESQQQLQREESELNAKKAFEERSLQELRDDNQRLQQELLERKGVFQKQLEQFEGSFTELRGRFVQQLRVKSLELECLNEQAKRTRDLRKANEALASRVDRQQRVILSLTNDIQKQKQLLRQQNEVGAGIERRQALLRERLAQYEQLVADQKKQTDELGRRDGVVVDKTARFERQTEEVAGLRSENGKLKAQFEKLKASFESLKSAKKEKDERKAPEKPSVSDVVTKVQKRMKKKIFQRIPGVKEVSFDLITTANLQKFTESLENSAKLLKVAQKGFQELANMFPKEKPSKD